MNLRNFKNNKFRTVSVSEATKAMLEEGVILVPNYDRSKKLKLKRKSNTMLLSEGRVALAPSKQLRKKLF